LKYQPFYHLTKQALNIVKTINTFDIAKEIMALFEHPKYPSKQNDIIETIKIAKNITVIFSMFST
jgi:hypothetical protein